MRAGARPGSSGHAWRCSGHRSDQREVTHLPVGFVLAEEQQSKREFSHGRWRPRVISGTVPRDTGGRGDGRGSSRGLVWFLSL